MKGTLNKRLISFASVAVVLAMLVPGFALIINSSLAIDPAGSENNMVPIVLAVPGAPRNLVADQGPGFVWLWWDHPATNGDELIKKYYIFRGETSGGQGATPLDWTYVGSTSYEGTDLGGVNFYNDTDVELDTTYYYKLTASSDAGNSSYSDEVFATPSMSGNTPGAPTVAGENQVYGAQINWTEPAVAGSTPVRFYFVYREPGIFMDTLLDDWSRETEYEDDVGFFTEIGVEYNYSVRAMNSYGQGEPGSVDVTIGGQGTDPGAPENLVAFGLNSSAVLSWNRPTNPSAGGFDKYDVYRSVSEGGSYAIVGNLTGIEFFGYEGYYFDNGLTNGQSYYYKVRSVNSSGPQSGYSNVARADPQAYQPPTYPFEVDELNAHPGDGKVLLMWDEAYNDTMDADSYKIYRSESPGTEVLLTTVGEVEHYFDTTVINGHTYYYKVEPIDGTTAGTKSPEDSVTPGTGSAPADPIGLRATPESYGVELYLPPSEPDSILIGYEIYRGESMGTQDTTPIDEVEDLDFNGGIYYTDDTADPDVTYYYKVKLLNMYGLSDSSNEAYSFASPTGDFPDPVTDLSATGGEGKITLQWNSPTYQGTANLLYYDIQRNDTDDTWDTIGYISRADPGAVEFVDDYFPIPGVTYSYRVLVSNNYGDALAPSNMDTASATSAVPNRVPSAPMDMAAQSGNGYIVLTWDVPTDVGNPALTTYNIYRATTSGGYGSALANVPAGTLTYNDTSAVPGTPYFYVVKAVNTVGPSPASDEATATATGSASNRMPSAPRNLAAQSGNGYIILTWDVPTDVGNPALMAYNIYRATTSGGYGSALANVPSGTLTYNDTTAVLDTPYFYVVKAVNSEGPSPASGEATATATSSETTLGAPQNLVATAGKGKVSLSWDAPAEDGGSAILNYQIYRMPAGGLVELIETVGAGTLTYVDDDVNAGTEYTYTVKAINALGTGPASTPSMANPLEGDGGGSDNTMLLIIGVVVVIAVVAGVAFFFLRKK